VSAARPAVTRAGLGSTADLPAGFTELAAVPTSGPRADPDRIPARVLSAIALASIAAGAINIAAATVGRPSTENLAFFVLVAAAQLAWGAVAPARAPRWWLALGAAGNLVVVATWVVSRTAGLARRRAMRPQLTDAPARSERAGTGLSSCIAFGGRARR
jgi:hypothetical protein